jgi:hypothetical protein
MSLQLQCHDKPMQTKTASSLRGRIDLIKNVWCLDFIALDFNQTLWRDLNDELFNFYRPLYRLGTAFACLVFYLKENACMKIIRDNLVSIIERTRGLPRLHDYTITFYNLFYPLPYQEVTMEFTPGVWEGISTIRCVEGRQIGETNSAPTAFYRPVPTQFHEAHLDGSRAGYSINLTALQHIMRLWPDLLSFIGVIRQLTMQRLGVTHNKLTTFEMYLVAFAGISVPAYMSRRKADPKSDLNISLVVADQYKLIAGVFMMVRHMLERGYSDLTKTTQLTGAELFDYCDQHGLFLAPTGAKTACGGAKRKIIELIDHVINGSNNELAITAAAQDSLDQLGDPQAFMDYVLAAAELEVSSMLARATIKNHLLSSPDFAENNISNKKKASQWDRVRNHLQKQSCTNTNLPHQITNLSEMLELIGAPPDYQSWLVLSKSSEKAELESLFKTFLMMTDYFEAKQKNVLRILGYADKDIGKLVRLRPIDINKRIKSLPMCVFNEIMAKA